MTAKILFKQVVVPASIPDVWRAWTTSEGAVTFFAPEAKIELRVGGPYEVYFDLDAAPGLRGSEECKVLSFLPMEMLSFDWSAPPELPNVRKQRSWIVVQFLPAEGGATRVKFTELGWGEGDEWEKCYAYFDRAWDIVLRRLKERFEKGPVDWDAV